MPPAQLVEELNAELLELPGDTDELAMRFKEMPDPVAMHAASYILGAVSNLLAKYADRWDEGEYGDDE